MKKITAVIFIIALSIGTIAYADELNELNLSKLYLEQVIQRATIEIARAREQLAIIEKRISLIREAKQPVAPVVDPADPPMAKEPEK